MTVSEAVQSLASFTGLASLRVRTIRQTVRKQRYKALCNVFDVEYDHFLGRAVACTVPPGFLRVFLANIWSVRRRVELVRGLQTARISIRKLNIQMLRRMAHPP
jgi:hypothetical protein